jgi:hypothetical protein
LWLPSASQPPLLQAGGFNGLRDGFRAILPRPLSSSIKHPCSDGLKCVEGEGSGNTMPVAFKRGRRTRGESEGKRLTARKYPALELAPVLEVVSFLKNWSELTVRAFRGVT